MEMNSHDLEAFWGRQAVDWLFGREDGGHFFDAAMIGVSESFGEEAEISAVVPLNWRADPLGFFLQVAGSVEDDGDWERLVKAHEALLLRRPLRSVPKRFSEFHLVLDPEPIAAVPWHQAQEAWR